MGTDCHILGKEMMSGTRLWLPAWICNSETPSHPAGPAPTPRLSACPGENQEPDSEGRVVMGNGGSSPKCEALLPWTPGRAKITVSPGSRRLQLGRKQVLCRPEAMLYVVISENSPQVRETPVFENKQGPCFWVLRMGMSCVLRGERGSPKLMQLSAE